MERASVVASSTVRVDRDASPALGGIAGSWPCACVGGTARPSLQAASGNMLGSVPRAQWVLDAVEDSVSGEMARIRDELSGLHREGKEHASKESEIKAELASFAERLSTKAERTEVIMKSDANSSNEPTRR